MARGATSHNEQALVGLRLAIGFGAWLAPRLTSRVMGLDPDSNPQSPYLVRLLGIRDLALAVGLNRSRGEARKLLIQLGILCDGADALAGLIAGRRRYLNRFVSCVVTAMALIGTAMGVRVLKAEQDAA